MPHYRRFMDREFPRVFLTFVTHKRRKILIQHINEFKHALTRAKQSRPFHLVAIVIMPDHCHMIIDMPEEDLNFSERIKLIKYYFTMQLNKKYNTKQKYWQNRFWDHLIRDDKDFHNHLNYLHYNPVKHGYVPIVNQWKYSSFMKYVKSGWYPYKWGETQFPANFELGDESSGE